MSPDQLNALISTIRAAHARGARITVDILPFERPDGEYLLGTAAPLTGSDGPATFPMPTYRSTRHHYSPDDKTDVNIFTEEV